MRLYGSRSHVGSDRDVPSATPGGANSGADDRDAQHCDALSAGLLYCICCICTSASCWTERVLHQSQVALVWPPDLIPLVRRPWRLGSLLWNLLNLRCAIPGGWLFVAGTSLCCTSNCKPVWGAPSDALSSGRAYAASCYLQDPSCGLHPTMCR